jgi:hypothetical protein
MMVTSGKHQQLQQILSFPPCSNHTTVTLVHNVCICQVTDVIVLNKLLCSSRIPLSERYLVSNTAPTQSEWTPSQPHSWRNTPPFATFLP